MNSIHVLEAEATAVLAILGLMAWGLRWFLRKRRKKKMAAPVQV